MLGRTFACAALIAGLVLPVSNRAHAADSPGEKLATDWSKSSDEERQALIDAAVATPSRAVLDALTKAARTSLGVHREAERLRKSLAAKLKELGPDAKDDDSRLASDRAEVENLAKQAKREAAALDRVAIAVGRVLDFIPDAEADTAIKDLMRAAPDPALEGFRAFVGQGIGASRLARTVIAVIDTPIESRREIAKLQTQRAEPARKLEEVIRKLNDAVDRYLKAARAKGDTSNTVPNGLVGTLPDQKDELDKVVNKLASAIDAADDRRRTARDALGRMLAGMVAGDADRVVDLVESRFLKAEDVEDRSFGFSVLGSAVGPRPFKLLTAAADGKDPRDAAVALEAMGDRAEPEVVSVLAKHLVDEAADWRLRTSAAVALARTGRAVAIPPLLDALKTAKGRLVDDLREALVSMTGLSYPAVEAPWRAWWDVAGTGFLGLKDPKPEKPVAAAPGVKAPPSAIPSKGEDGFTFYGIESHSMRMLFILDFSGSMIWAGSESDEKLKKIDILRKEMQKSLAGLPDGSTFNVIAFSSDVRPWKKEPQVRTAKAAAEALLWVQKAPVDGGTNIGDAFEVAFKMMGVGLQKDRTEAPAFDTVFFMTDGKPTVGKVIDPKQILASVRRWNEGRKVRIHVVGMGGHKKAVPGAAPGKLKEKDKEDDMDEDFLKALAEQNGGQCVIH